MIFKVLIVLYINHENFVSVNNVLRKYDEVNAISKLNDLLEEMDIPIVKNRDINVDHLGSKGLHLNPHEIARFAMNLKASIRNL